MTHCVLDKAHIDAPVFVQNSLWLQYHLASEWTWAPAPRATIKALQLPPIVSSNRHRSKVIARLRIHRYAELPSDMYICSLHPSKPTSISLASASSKLSIEIQVVSLNFGVD